MWLRVADLLAVKIHSCATIRKWRLSAFSTIWDWSAYFSSALLRNALALHCCDFGWLISRPSRFTAVPRLGSDGFQHFQLCLLEQPATWPFFLDTSPAIAFTGTKGLAIPWSVFFDDCILHSLVISRVQADMTSCAEVLFKLSSIIFASEGSKAPPFSARLQTLGLVVNTEKACERTARLGHTPERFSELLQSMKSVLARNRVSTITLEQCLAGLFGSVLLFSVRFEKALKNALQKSLWTQLCKWFPSSERIYQKHWWTNLFRIQSALSMNSKPSPWRLRSKSGPGAFSESLLPITLMTMQPDQFSFRRTLLPPWDPL